MEVEQLVLFLVSLPSASHSLLGQVVRNSAVGGVTVTVVVTVTLLQLQTNCNGATDTV